MKCPKCGANVRRPSDICQNCGYNLAPPPAPAAEQPGDKPQPFRASTIGKALMLFVMLIFSVGFFGLIIYNGYWWYDSWRMNRIYDTGEIMAPEVEEIDMDDGRVGRAITFYGRDGNEVFIPELGKSYAFIGGLTRIEVADAHWFGASPEEQESALVTLMPVVYTDGGDMVQMPALEMDIPTPASPLEMIDPAQDLTTVITSMYTLKFRVVLGSTVMINGEDVSDLIKTEDRTLERQIRVDPTGDNKVSIFVSTPNHRQTRRDVILYRAPQTINLEPNVNLNKSTNKSTFTFSGTTEPGAQIVVDSKYVEDSLKLKATGDFSFQAKLSTIGDNTISLHATMPGREDQYMNYTIYYVPTLNEYSRKGWRIDRLSDYQALLPMTDIWNGQVYQCKGTVTEIMEDVTPQTFAMNLAGAGEEARYVIIENRSSVQNLVVGQRYYAWADVTGNEFYDSKRVPKLIARYVLTPSE